LKLSQLLWNGNFIYKAKDIILALNISLVVNSLSVSFPPRFVFLDVGNITAGTGGGIYSEKSGSDLLGKPAFCSCKFTAWLSGLSLALCHRRGRGFGVDNNTGFSYQFAPGRVVSNQNHLQRQQDEITDNLVAIN
jgi:hypothetical protein